MAMKETKSMNIQPGTEEQVINLWRSFGWELIGAPQEIYNKDSHQEMQGDDLYNVTETTHYVKITFERDPARPNYEELKSLESQFYSIEDPYFPPAPRFITLLWVILILAGFCLFIVPGVILLVLHIVSFVKKNKKWNYEEYPEYKAKQTEADKQRSEILAKAQSLV